MDHCRRGDCWGVVKLTHEWFGREDSWFLTLHDARINSGQYPAPERREAFHEHLGEQQDPTVKAVLRPTPATVTAALKQAIADCRLSVYQITKGDRPHGRLELSVELHLGRHLQQVRTGERQGQGRQNQRHEPPKAATWEFPLRTFVLDRLSSVKNVAVRRTENNQTTS